MNKINKIIICIIIIIIFLFTGLTMAQSDYQVNVSIDGVKINYNNDYGYPFIDENNRTLVPFRITLEEIGAIVSWNEETKTAIAERNGIRVEVPIGKNFIRIIGKDENMTKTEIDTLAVAKYGRTYLPIRAVLEAFGAQVEWNNSTQTVVVTNVFNTIESVSAKNMPNGVYLEVLPRIELLSGVLSHTSWIDVRGPKGLGNKYFRDLKNFFNTYRDHEAIEIAEQLTQADFTYDAQPNFILNLGELPYLRKDGEFSDYIVGRAWGLGGDTILEKFRLALIDLAVESNFEQFFNEHRRDYEEQIDKISKGFKPREIIEWQRDFFGWEGSYYHTVLAPAMFPSGGYGATAEKSNGENHIYQVVREDGYTETEPEFGDGELLNLLSIHEWGHSFVNPSMEERGFDILFKSEELRKLFEPVKEIMMEQAYGSISTFYNEQIIRAMEVIAQKDLYGNTYAKREIELNERSGFYLTRFTVEQLEYYRENRDTYKTFKDFIPYLLKQYEKNQEELLRLIE